MCSHDLDIIQSTQRAKEFLLVRTVVIHSSLIFLCVTNYEHDNMNSLFVWLSLAAILQTTTPQDTPDITFVSPKQVKKIGDTVDLKCSTKNARDFPICWVKVEDVDNIYISSGTALLIPDNRYNVTYDHASSSIMLRIRDLQSTDAGRYQCSLHIAPDNIIHSADVQLELIESPN